MLEQARPDETVRLPLAEAINGAADAMTPRDWSNRIPELCTGASGERGSASAREPSPGKAAGQVARCALPTGTARGGKLTAMRTHVGGADPVSLNQLAHHWRTDWPARKRGSIVAAAAGLCAATIRAWACRSSILSPNFCAVVSATSARRHQNGRVAVWAPTISQSVLQAAV